MQDAFFGARRHDANRHHLSIAPSSRTTLPIATNADGTFRAQTRRFPARAAGSMTTSADDLGRFVSAQNYMICFERRQARMIALTNSDNGELPFRLLIETILGNTVTPWEWEDYTPSYLQRSRKQRNGTGPARPAPLTRAIRSSLPRRSFRTQP
jgi:hypothetical protein